MNMSRFHLKISTVVQKNQFEKYSKEATNTYEVPYDYYSVMHYGKDAFSRNGKDTITPKHKLKGDFGNKEGLSFSDIMVANLMYNCSEGCNNTKSCPPQSFMGKDCRCYCKIPNKKTGSQVCPTTTATTTSPPECVDKDLHCAEIIDDFQGLGEKR